MSQVSWFAGTEEAKQCLIQAAEQWDNTEAANQWMEQALAAGGDSIDVLVAGYRYFFYKNNSLMALLIANKVVEHIKTVEQLPDDWTQLKPILLNHAENPLLRLYLTAYSASGMLLAKLGDVEQAKEISTRIQEVDTKNEFGASLILDILTKPVEDDD